MRKTQKAGLNARLYDDRRLGLDFTRFARICLQTDTWLRELRDAQKTTARA